MKNKFLLIWGMIITFTSIEEFFHPASTLKILSSPILISAMLIIGIALMISFIVVNRNFRIGKAIAVSALILNLIYYLAALVFIVILFHSTPLQLCIVMLIDLGFIALLSGYVYSLLKQETR